MIIVKKQYLPHTDFGGYKQTHVLSRAAERMYMDKLTTLYSLVSQTLTFSNIDNTYLDELLSLAIEYDRRHNRKSNGTDNGTGNLELSFVAKKL